MNKIITQCDTHEDWFNVKHSFANMRKQIFDRTLSQEQPTEAQKYILLLMTQALEYLRMNPNVIVVSSDKGGKLVIMNRTDYMIKMQDY